MAVRTGTLIPATWEFTREELPSVNPRHLKASLRTDLYSKGAAKAEGWLVAVLHGEFDPVSCLFRLHAHVVADGEMVDVVDRLRELPKYRTARFLPNGQRSPVYRRVMIGRKDLTNLPDPLTYPWQAFWPSRAIFVNADGEQRRQRHKARIEEPYHSTVLLWLDQWSLADITLLIGLRASKSGLIRTSR